MEQYTEANNAGRTGRKGRSRSVGTAEVMKYVIAVLILGYVAVNPAIYRGQQQAV